MTVARKVKGKRYCILHAGWMYGWIGEPRVWPAKYGGTSDYHENMNSSIFEKYLDDLCRHCKDELGFPSVVFVMDNAKYHRREYQGDHDSIHRLSSANLEADVEEDEPKHKTLCQLTKPELYDRLCRLGAERETIQHLGKAALYEMAKRPEYKVLLATEVIVKRHVHFFFFFFT